MHYIDLNLFSPLLAMQQQINTPLGSNMHCDVKACSGTHVLLSTCWAHGSEKWLE